MAREKCGERIGETRIVSHGKGLDRANSIVRQDSETRVCSAYVAQQNLVWIAAHLNPPEL
jgi:hypothetical protein